MNPASSTEDIVASVPGAGTDFDPALRAACIEALLACVTRTTCADACLFEPTVPDLRACIRLDLDCADVCGTVVRLLSRASTVGSQPAVVRAFVAMCADLCGVCARECQEHASMHEHCRLCAEACFRCEDACRRLLDG